jgi:hypothetical protein
MTHHRDPGRQASRRVRHLLRTNHRVVEIGERAITQRETGAMVTVPKIAWEGYHAPPQKCHVVYYPRLDRLVYQLPNEVCCGPPVGCDATQPTN